MRISDWSSDVCSSDLFEEPETYDRLQEAEKELARHGIKLERIVGDRFEGVIVDTINDVYMDRSASSSREQEYRALEQIEKDGGVTPLGKLRERSEEHTSELQSLMRISYAVFCLKKKKQRKQS